MPTKSEAAEALYRAGLAWSDARANHRLTLLECVSLDAAIAAYSTATPDALPAEVQRVVEAAGHVIHATRVNHPDAADAWGDLETAVDAYRSSQPEPLSARLARLKPGSVVGLARCSKATVIANHPATETLFVEWIWNGERKSNAVVYSGVLAILSESP